MQRFLKTGLVTCLAIIFSLVIYGCGGGGSSGPAAMPDPEPEPVTPTVTNADKLSIPAGDHTIAAGMTDDVGEGEAEVTLTCSAAAACAFTVAEDGTVTPTSGEVTVARSAAAMALITAREEEERKAKIAADTKAAGTKRMAIATEGGQTTDAGLGGSSAPAPTAGQVAGEYNLNIKHGETSIVKEAAAEDDNETFTQQDMDLGDGTTMHVLTMDAEDDGDVVEEVVMVHTDIEAPTPTAFAMVVTLDGNPETDGGTDYQSLNIVDANIAMLMTDGITSTGAGTITLVSAREDDASTTDVDETRAAFSTPATFRGASGTLTCGGTTDCTATLDADGDITAVTEGWIFTPGDGATIDVPDSDYLHYGFWLQRTTDADGEVTYNEVETFAGSSVDASGDVAAVTGSATYSGGALGVYVHSVTNPDGTEASATSGHFTADVALTATFGQVPVSADDSTGTIAPNLLNTLSGTINNFMLSGHDEGPGWSVALQGAIAPDAGTVTGGTAKGGNGDGSLTATFHGDVTAVDGVVPKPSSVVGEFNAGFSDGSVAGAFGATKDD